MPEPKETLYGFPQQKGTVLLVSLVLLLILSLIGLGAMDRALLELKMSSFFQGEIQTLNEAERNIRVAEAVLESMVADSARFDFNTADDGFYDSSSALLNVIDWSAMTTEIGVGNRGNSNHYIVEYIGKKTLPGNSIALNPDGEITGDAVHAYVITARSLLGPGSTNILQSSYTTEKIP